MSGSIKGGKQAAKTNQKKYDEQYQKKYGMGFYERLGQQGGRVSRGGGFASNKIGSDGLTGKQRAVVAGALGGKRKRFN